MPSATGLQASYASATGHLSTQQSLQQAYFSMSTVTQNEVSPHGVVIINGAHTSSANNDFQHTTQRQNDSLLVIEPAHSPPTHVSNNHTTSQIERDHGYNLTPASAPRIVGNVNDLPNFLEGFDMIASRRDANTPGKQHPTPDLAHFSPTYTSRSFDDFHRLLGKNLSPDTRRQETRDVPAFDINELPFPAPHIQNDLPMEFGSEDPANVFTNDRATHLFSTLKPKITSRELPEHHRQKTCQTNGQTVSVGVTGTELGADSYSIFAQQSAFAASQHSAYSSTRGNGDDSSLALLGDDLEMMLGDNYTSGDAISTPYCVGTHISGTVYTSSSRGATLVSEPSDQGSDEIHGDSYGSGTDNLVDGSSCSNDSDGSYSESSRKRARLSHHVYDDINAAVHQPIRDY